MHPPSLGIQPKLCIQFITPAFALYKISLAHTLSLDASVTSSTVPHVPPRLALASYVLSLCGSLDMLSLGPK
jgi:hypothetical protein